MFIDIAGLLNIAKWAYFIIVAKVHIDIRRQDRLKFALANSNIATVKDQTDNS